MRVALLVLSSLLMACGSTDAVVRTDNPVTPAPRASAVVRPTEAVAIASAPLTPPTLRVPAAVRPVSYTAELRIDPEQDRFEGAITIEVDVTTATKEVWLHGVGLTVLEATIEPRGGAPKPARVQAMEPWLHLVVDGEVPRGHAVLRLRWRGTIDSERSRGLYRVKEPDGRWYAYTFFEPVDARRVFPCFDEPGLKTPWTLVIDTPAGNVVAANTSLRQATGTRHEFNASWPMASYQVAFMVGPFAIVDGGTGGRAATPIRFIVPPGHEAELAWARQATPRSLAVLEDYFDLPYPFGKLDVAVVPRYWGTMEHPGLVAMGQPLTLITPEEDSTGRRISYANILIHELGHYWFGDLVTMAWWDDTWLNEGLTTWLDVKMTDAFEPTWRYHLDRLQRQRMAFGGDSLAAAQAMRVPITNATDIEASFDNQTTYYKGASVAFMLEHVVGEATMQRAVRRYLRAHEHGTATTEQFLAALVAESGPDAALVLASFVEQPGVPLVKVALRCDAGAAPTLELAQERYWPEGSAGVHGAAQTWQVPLCVRYGRGTHETRRCGVLKDARAAWTLDDANGCPAWVVGNEGARGYYRVELSPPLRASLLQRAARLPAEERSALASDVAALVVAGHAPVSDALALVPRLAADREPLVATRAVAITGFIDDDLLDDADRARYRRMVGKLFGASARTLGWRNAANDDPLRRAHRAAVLSLVAHQGRDARLLDEAARLARAWLGDRKAVDPDLVDVIISAAALRGGKPLFDAYIAEARRTDDREDRARLLGALGAFGEAALAEAALALVLGDEFDVRETSDIVGSVLGERTTRALGWSWVEAHWDEMAARMRDDEKGWSMQMAAVFCDVEARRRAEAFFAPRAAAIDGGPHALAKALERIDLCIVQRQQQAADIHAFLAAY